MPDYLSRKEAADYLNKRGLKTAPGTLQKMASTGGGPLYQIYGKTAVYTPPNLDSWARSRMREPRRHTSEVVRGAAKDVPKR